ncbi:MAG: lysophospholipid acyltransferase family protein [Roseovarius sp.]|nr:lysophospholipid acyltransferase family protein [Roseovarius sp.]MCY4207075.1 lysophospholipid acyltransferase family protein [Roseovarius sp.]MCY4292810.1 lysophospholipid acyltransferase family protein [Roseovarius sp.]MCY4316914.1 lysophospholipid acyltransferase family protein [Roseovarius sp.]
MGDNKTQERIPLFERFTGNVLYAPFLLVLPLPYKFRVAFGGWLTSNIIAPILGYRRRIRINLAYACPELPKSEVKRLIRKVPDNVGRNIVELYSPEFSTRARNSKVEGPGIEIARAAIAENRPAIMITGHFGNFNAARMAVVEQGLNVGIFYRRLSNRTYNGHYVRAMSELSEPMFEQSPIGIVRMIRHLRAGGVVAILNDLNVQDGYPLDFFGKPALTSLSPAEMALRFNAPLITGWGLRDKNGIDFKIITDDEIPPSDPLTMTREFNRRLEQRVRENMDQWFWVHRRWKDGTGEVAKIRAMQMREMRRPR